MANNKINIEIVEKGYKKVAKWYREQKTPDQNKISLFLNFLKNETNNEILELGCGSGYPIGEEIIKFGKKMYTGIDLSKEQIELAKSQYPEASEHFIQAEMLDYCEKASSDHYSGIISLFSIRHLPRVMHAMLYSEIYRILKPEGLLLIDCTEKPHDGTDLWSNNNEVMYWSGFSKEWTMQTLTDLGFDLMESLIDEKEFNGRIERTLYFLYQKK